MLKVREGDIDKLGLLFGRHKKPLFGFFYGLTRDAELCEDLVQTVFLRILKYRHLFRGDGDFRTWLFHIARNVNNDHFRKTKWRNGDPIDEWENRLGTQENRDAQYENDEKIMLLEKALQRLPHEKREVLMLSKFQERKYREIGEILGCSEGAVKVKVFRALQDLKEVYRQLEKNA